MPINNSAALGDCRCIVDEPGETQDSNGPAAFMDFRIIVAELECDENPDSSQQTGGIDDLCLSVGTT